MDRFGDVDYSAADQLAPPATLVFIIAWSALLLLGIVFAIVFMRIHARRAREAAASVRSDAPDVRAGHIVLRGTVETEDPKRPAIVVTLTQHGTEHSHKGKWSHTWTETDRRTQAEPFWLVLESGRRVRVEPGDDVLLVDRLAAVPKDWVDWTKRVLGAKLEHGEIACVEGMLSEGWHDRMSAQDEAPAGLYRGSAQPKGLVLRSGREGMLVSTEPLAQRHERRHAAHRLMSRVLVVVLVLANVLLFGGAHLVNAFGTDVDVSITNTRTWITRNKNSTTRHYGVMGTYTTSTGETRAIEDEVGFATYTDARSTALKKIPFRVVEAWPKFFSVGTGATIGVWRAIVAVVLLLGLYIGYVAAVRGAREWYETDCLKEKKSGRLPK